MINGNALLWRATWADRPAFRITKTSEAVCIQDAVSEWPTAARRRFRGGHHGAWLTRSTWRAPSSRGTPITRS